MATDIENMNTETISQILKNNQLEYAYERALRQAERIYEEERERVLRVQLLLLEDENDDLQEQVAENDDEMNKLENNNVDLRQRIEEVERDLQQTRTELKTRLRDIDHFKAEVEALNASNSDATKILSEKLALTRELAVVKPELEHLKSQNATQQNVLAEKLSLQRELSAIQVELDNEKRTIQRIKGQDKSSTNDDSTLVAEVEELKKELAKAQRDAQKNERENRKKLTDWETQKENMENKLDAFRTKLRTTKEQLKEAQDEIERMQSVKMARSAEMTKARLTGVNPKKRNVAHFDPDMTIGTPGGAAKKQRTSVSVGDKSTFSITPFLNRTMSILPESPTIEDQEDHQKVDEVLSKQIDALAEVAEREATPAAKKTKPAPKKAKPEPLKETTNISSKPNPISLKPRLPKVTEEENEDGSIENMPPSTNSSDEPVKKKQKILVKRTNIFDEEDDNAASNKTKTLSLSSIRAGNGTTSLGKINLTGLGKAKGKTKVLAEFSPLKKDRKMASAIAA